MNSAQTDGKAALEKQHYIKSGLDLSVCAKKGKVRSRVWFFFFFTKHVYKQDGILLKCLCCPRSLYLAPP